MRGNMINKLYKKIFLIYYITSVTFITFITLFMIYSNYSSSISSRSLLFQSYTNNMILQLQNNIAISEKAIEQYNANIPMLVLATAENDNILFSYRSSEIEISSDLLQEKIQEQMHHYFKTDSIHNNASPQLYSFETTELNGEKLKWSYIQINASNGTMYKLYTACLINHKIFSFSQIVQYIFLEIFLLAAFFFLGKYYGLGLSIAKTIMDLHHGKISIKDTPGGGATFILEFPMHK